MVGDLFDPPVAYFVTQQFMFVFDKRPGFKLYVFKVGQTLKESHETVGFFLVSNNFGTDFSNEKWFFSYLNELLFM